MSNTWFRMYSEFATDPKVQSMSEVMQRRLTMLFCFESNGELHKLSHDELAFALRIDDVTLHETLHVFHQKGFCDENGGLKNWNKRQFKSDSSAERVKKFREKSKTKENVMPVKRYSNGSVTPPDTDTEKKEEDSLRSSSSKTKAKKSGDEAPPGFDDFRSAYPPNTASRAAILKSYRKAINEGTDHATITAAAAAYAGYTTATGCLIAHATTWLNQQRWTVDYDAIAQPGHGAGSGARPHGVQVQTGGEGTPILRADNRDPATRARDEGQRIIAQRRAERESAAGRSGGAGPGDAAALAGLCQPEYLRGQGGDDGIPRPDVPASAGAIPDLTGERGVH